MTAGDEPAGEPSPDDVSQRYHLLLELSPDAIVVHQDARIVYANRAALEFAQIDDRSAMLGRLISDFVSAESMPEMVARIVSMGTRPGASSGPSEVTMVTSRGDRKRMQVMSVRTMWQNAPAYQVILRDDSAAERAEGAVRRQVAVTEHVSDAVIATDRLGRVRAWNPAAEQMYGRRALDVIGGCLSEAIGAELDPAAVVAIGGAVTGPHRRASSDRTFLAHTTVTVVDEGYLLVATETRRPLINRLGTILSALYQAVFVAVDDGHVVLANPAATDMLGLAADAVPGLSLAELPLDFADGESAIADCLVSGQPIYDRTATIATDGGTRWVSCSCRLLDEDPTQRAVLVSLVDITGHHRNVVRLSWEAHHDDLTGLLNRTGIVGVLASQIADAEHSGGRVALCYVEVDNFKLVTDSLGHVVGDEMLRALAGRIRYSVPFGVEVARVGGAEFVVVIGLDADGAEKLDAVVAGIHAAISEPIMHKSRTERFTVRVGVAISSADAAVATDLMRNASIALHQAQLTQRGPYVLFERHHLVQVQERQRVEQELRDTLRDDPDRLLLSFQPVVNVTDSRIVGVETLVRWDHPERSMVGPNAFIPVAEESDLIALIGDHVLRQAISQFAAQRWAADMWLAVNVSRRELGDPHLTTRVKRYLAQAGLAPQRLCVEITERVLASDDEQVRLTVIALREAGIAVALDDFGTGLSSLGQLYGLPTNGIKIAQDFITALDVHDGAEAILTNIVNIAHATGRFVVVEGIETQRQAQIVAASGSELAQGYYYGRPMPLADIGLRVTGM